jgi:hypothetical protein
LRPLPQSLWRHFDILARIANDHPINRIDELLPWTWIANR